MLFWVCFVTAALEFWTCFFILKCGADVCINTTWRIVHRNTSAW